jgi:hypothetical protein
VKVALTPVRVVCMNTLSFALRRATRVWSTPHLCNIYWRLDEARKALQLTTNYMRALQEDGERLAEKPMDLQQFIEMLLPLPDEDAGEQAVKNVYDMRETLYFHAKSEDLKPFAGTAWQGVQAVVSFTTHAEPLRLTETWRERRWESLIDGHRLQQKAHELAWNLVGGRG